MSWLIIFIFNKLMASSINYNIYRTLYISRGKYDAPWQEFFGQCSACNI